MTFRTNQIVNGCRAPHPDPAMRGYVCTLILGHEIHVDHAATPEITWPV